MPRTNTHMQEWAFRLLIPGLDRPRVIDARRWTRPFESVVYAPEHVKSVLAYYFDRESQDGREVWIANPNWLASIGGAWRVFGCDLSGPDHRTEKWYMSNYWHTVKMLIQAPKGVTE